MNSAADVTNLIKNYAAMGLTRAEMVIRVAEACMGWPYVWGGAGQKCTPGYRQSYADRPACPEAEARQIVNLCQVLNGKRSSCDGCKWFPTSCVLFFDCRGFTRWVLQQAGITIQGAGATSQWNTESNWAAKGTIDNMPENTVCCVFMQNQKDHKTMEHTGFCIGGGQVIHCSGEVKRGKITDRGWTHWAIPKGMDGDVPVPTPTHATIRRGSTGPDVVECQQDLIQLGYDLSPYGADGKFGAKTETAVKAFQTASGLKADGIVGKATWAALDAAVGPQPGPTPQAMFTVTIPHCTEVQADALLAEYPGSWKTAEGGE